MARGPMVSAREKRFFTRIARQFPETITSRDKAWIMQEHKDTFGIRRTEIAVMGHVRSAKKKLNGGRKRKEVSLFKIIECSALKASPVENLLIDLADALKELVKENEELKRKLAEKESWLKRKYQSV